MLGGLEVVALVHHYGLPVMFAGVALESMGLPVPGETVLVLAAATLAHGGHVGYWPVLLVAASAAVVGDNLGYLVGRFGGWPLLRRFGPRLHLDQGSLKVARYLFARGGGVVVFGGRFVALLRTSAAFLAGVNHMPWWRFLLLNATGGVLWATVWTTLAFLFGARLARLPAGATWAGVALLAVGVVAGVLLVRRKVRDLREVAERAYPGPL